jgi:hypothetical protein
MLYDTLEYDPMAALGPLVPASPTASLGLVGLARG